MKKLLVFLLIFTLSTLVACKNAAQESHQNGNFIVEFLFEQNGCKVYRFQDGSRYVYWSDCSGNIQSDVYRSNGKNGGYTEHIDSITN